MSEAPLLLCPGRVTVTRRRRRDSDSRDNHHAILGHLLNT
ncbi:hypothetical protein E2C01_088586 [Portunus trituberculatus]|uniref:Uncharacterized protein n=1 Tax=Portunus trituberculatus TaxID=210409 RepID=A0A5B7JKA2_PORTR|nr:hypothetical protein [Portunus trituberculatus]